MQKNNRRMIAHLLGLLIALMWGTTFVSTKVLLMDFDAITIMLYRFIIGYILLVIFKPKPMAFMGIATEIWCFLAGLSGITLYFLCENSALQLSTAGNTSVIVSTAPIFTALLAFIFLKEEKPTVFFFIGFVIAIGGILLINFNASVNLHLNPVGDLMAVGAAIIWAVYSVILKKKLNIKGFTLQVTRRILFYGILSIIPCMFIFNQHFNLNALTEPKNILNLLFLGAGATAFGYYAWNHIVDVLGAVKASVYIYILPVITIIASYIFLDEDISLLMAIGAILTIVGLIISEKKSKIEKQKKE